MEARFLTDAQWEKIAPLLPGRTGTVGVTAKDNRLFIDAVYGLLVQVHLGDYYPPVSGDGIACLNGFGDGVKLTSGVLFLKNCKILRILSMS